ncbi:MAG: hypothetical protein P1V19_12330, partial [Gimesia sp.]|nr:hypothetical protein [Gimesia sp.]
MFDQTHEEGNHSSSGENEPNELLQNQTEIQQRIAAQEIRKLKAKNEKHHTIWFGLGMFGLIGWSVAIPA